jgi:hypothetical protein
VKTWIACVLGLVFVIAVSATSSVNAAAIRPTSPATAAGTVDTEFDVLIEVSDVTNLFGVSFVLNFDPAYLNAISETAESFLGADLVFLPVRDNPNGKVSVGISRKAGQGGMDGTGNVVKVRFRVVQGVVTDTPTDFMITEVTAIDPTGSSVTLDPESSATTFLGSSSATGSIRPVSPSSVNKGTTSEFDVFIEAADVTNLFGVSFELNFDQTVVNAVSESVESFLGADVVFLPVRDNTNGKVSVGISRKAGQGGVNGTGNVLKIRFQILAYLTEDTPVEFSLSAVTAIDASGNPIVLTVKSSTTDIITAVEDQGPGRTFPDSYVLYQNHPNPFNPSTTIRYGLPRAANVWLDVVDASGREIETLVRERQDKGEYDVRFEAKSLPTGLYFCRFRTGETILTKKIVLIR